MKALKLFKELEDVAFQITNILMKSNFNLLDIYKIVTEPISGIIYYEIYLELEVNIFPRKSINDI